MASSAQDAGTQSLSRSNSRQSNLSGMGSRSASFSNNLNSLGASAGGMGSRSGSFKDLAGMGVSRPASGMGSRSGSFKDLAGIGGKSGSFANLRDLDASLAMEQIQEHREHDDFEHFEDDEDHDRSNRAQLSADLVFPPPSGPASEIEHRFTRDAQTNRDFLVGALSARTLLQTATSNHARSKMPRNDAVLQRLDRLSDERDEEILATPGGLTHILEGEMRKGAASEEMNDKSL